MIDPRLLFTGLLATPVLALAAMPEDPAAETVAIPDVLARYHRAYYLEHSGENLAEAKALYEEVARESPDPALQTRARTAAMGIGEDLAAEDFTRLVPKTTLAYVELQDTGERLAGLLGELGLMNDGSWRDTGEAYGMPGISPHLVQGLFGMRAAAVAITRIDPMKGQPVGIGIFHPGSDEFARGLAETIVQNGAMPVESIHGCATWEIPGQAHVTFTQRLIFVSQSAREIASAIQRLRSGGSSFYDSPALTTTRDLRGEDLAFFCLNTEPLMPLVKMGLAMAAAEEPRVAAFSTLFDPTSLRAITGRIGLGKEGVGVDLAMQLKEGHSNRAYNFFRMPSVDDAVLDLVPEGTAFVLATGLNEPSGSSMGIVDSKGEAVVSWMDMGRELFGNLVDVVVFGMPTMLDETGDGQPGVAAILRVNDIERSYAMWDLVLGLATQSSTGKKAPSSQVAGATVTHYSLDGQPLHVARSGGELVVSPSRQAVERALVARDRGYAVQQDDVLAGAFDAFQSGRTLALVASPGRVAEMMEPFAAEGAERSSLVATGEMLGESVVAFDLTHSETRMAFHLGFGQVPNLRGYAADAVAQALGGLPLSPDALQEQMARPASLLESLAVAPAQEQK